MNIAIAIQLPLLQQGGVEVLARVFLQCAKLENRIFLVSQDCKSELGRTSYGNKISGHFLVPEGVISQDWMDLLVDWLQENQIEICHFHLTGTYGWDLWTGKMNAVIAVARSGIRTFTTNHQVISHFDRAYYPRSWLRNLLGYLRHWPIKLRQLMVVEREIYVSKHDLAILRRCYPFLSHKMKQIYHSRLNEDTVYQERVNREVILNMGTIAYRKGQHILVRAFAEIAEKYPSWNLKLVGYLAEPACDEEIRQVIQKQGLEKRVILHGPDPKPTKHYLEAAIYVQPSTVEGLGLSLQEAMFNGCACIGSNTGGIPELLDDSSIGMLFEPGNVSHLAAMLELLIQNPHQRKVMGLKARESILNRGMTRQAMLNAYDQIYLEGRTNDVATRKS